MAREERIHRDLWVGKKPVKRRLIGFRLHLLREAVNRDAKIWHTIRCRRLSTRASPNPTPSYS